MKVLHINTTAKGGAANACIGLHASLLQNGGDSKLLTLRNSNQFIAQHYIYGDIIHQPKMSLLSKINNKLTKRKKELEKVRKKDFFKEVAPEADHFSFIDTSYDITQLSIFKEADIINLHWTADFLDWPTFFSLKNTKKIVWTLHDMNPFTGGYHYAGNYKGYQFDDQDYPPAKQTHFPNVTQQNLNRKKAILQQFGMDLQIVSPSQWLYDVSKSSLLFKNYPHHLIPYGVDTDIFRPLDKGFCRQIFGLSSDKLILLFVSQDVNKYRKGFGKLLNSLPILADQHELVVCSVGNIPHNDYTSSVQHIPLNTIQDQRLMAVAYNAADAFVIPSLEDNLPNTVLEAIACATPVIGFAIGGIIDMVKNGFNGYLSEEINEQGLVKAIRRFIDHHEELSFSAIRKDAIDRYSPNIQATAYEKLYNEILG